MTEQYIKEVEQLFIKCIEECSKRVRRNPKMIKRGNLKYIIWKLKNKTI